MAEPAVVRVAARDAELEPDPLEPDQVVVGDPRASAMVLARSPEGRDYSLSAG